MTALPIAFVTFKRVVLTTLAAGPLNVSVERSGPEWICKLDDGVKLIGVPPVVGMMTSEAAAAGFAKAALQMALTAFAENDAEPAGTVQ